jgi:methionyl-tRNA synthetase
LLVKDQSYPFVPYQNALKSFHSQSHAPFQGGLHNFMKKSKRKILVTAALPYANGPIHLGHLVEYVQTDIWVRFQRLRGHRCIFMWADDTHGTAIMIRARAEGRREEDVIAQASDEHERDFAGFQIAYDNYGSTHSEENRQLCGEIWQAIRDKGLVKEKDVEQLYDTEQGTFLADRFVRGTCPNCKSIDQPGDNCSKCNETYSPADLIDPVSTLSGTKPETRTAKHLFIELEQLHGFLDQWTQSGNHLQPEVANYLKGHFLGDPASEEGSKPLRDWDISRPAPYFGFEIPDSPGNFWYVWFDAPIGYIASTLQWCNKSGEKLEDWWKSDDTEIHHFLGKDITYFHTLFWPGMLKSAGYSLPTKVHIHGFLTVNGEKMSKSKGTAFKAETFLKHLDPSALRYFYASKLGPRLDDIDLNFDEFLNKVNADLVNKVVNLASRSAKFVEAVGLSPVYPDDGGLFAEAAAAGDEIADAYENCDYNKAMRLIIELADRANPFVENAAPWTLKKDPEKAQELQGVCSVALNLFRQLVIYLAPVLPDLVEKAGKLLNDPIESWDQSKIPLTGTPVSKFKHMLKRIEEKDISAMVEESKAEAEAESAAVVADQFHDNGQPLADEPLADECTIDDFVKVDLRVARVVQAEHVEGARKLLKLTLSLGGDHRREVFAGIKAAYEPESLVGRLVVMVANLKPRLMKFGLSEGMVCASGSGGEEVFLLNPDEGATPGQRVH